MRLDRPFQTVTTSVDGDVLDVLARADAWYSVSRIRGLMGRRRSSEGIRRALSRLVEQGVVLRSDAASTPAYSLNREHLAAPAIIGLSSLRGVFLGRLRERIVAWSSVPSYAAVFGSAARGGMRVDSDIDLFFAADDPDRLWESGMEQLLADVHAWTGNAPGVVVYETSTIRGRAVADPVLVSISTEGLFVVGDRTTFREEVEGTRRGS